MMGHEMYKNKQNGGGGGGGGFYSHQHHQAFTFDFDELFRHFENDFDFFDDFDQKPFGHHHQHHDSFMNFVSDFLSLLVCTFFYYLLITSLLSMCISMLRPIF